MAYKKLSDIGFVQATLRHSQGQILQCIDGSRKFYVVGIQEDECCASGYSFISTHKGMILAKVVGVGCSDFLGTLISTLLTESMLTDVSGMALH